MTIYRIQERGQHWPRAILATMGTLLLFLAFVSFRSGNESLLRRQTRHYRNESSSLPSRRKLYAGNSPVDLERNIKYRDNDKKSNISSTTLLTIEATEQPLFYCPECAGAVSQQQLQILAALSKQFSQVQVLSKTHRLANAMFLSITTTIHEEEEEFSAGQVFDFIRQIPGVHRVYPREELRISISRVNAKEEDKGDYHRFNDRRRTTTQRSTQSDTDTSCYTGTGIRIAVLDSGIDYTHERLGGPGTVLAYRRAYGIRPESNRNKVVNNLFPTERVVAGYDFLGESFHHAEDTTAEDAKPDYDPIDAAPGHGTAVADAILQVAPEAQLMALKVCISDTNTCPDFAIVQALEYALDPNEDGNTDDKVDIVNLSLGLPHFSPYHDFISKMLEEVFQLGVVPVVAVGNDGNIPFIAGFASIAPNVVSVGSSVYDPTNEPIIAPYSSRGPGFNAIVKPDLVAPSGLMLAAAGTGDLMYASLTGTSFSAPLVAGALAVVKQKCDEACSPFALRAILMNNAYRNIRYSENSTDPQQGAPISLMGAGEIRIDQSLKAPFWAYSVEDVQPSLSLGVVNVAANIVLRRTVRVTNLSQRNHTLRLSSEFRDKAKQETGVLTIELETKQTALQANSAGCNMSQYVDLDLLFRIDASKVPANHLTSTGANRTDALTTLDVNEFGFHIVILSEESGEEISLPGLAILRQAANVTVESPTLQGFNGGPTNIDIGLINHGQGVAQVDAFQILSLSPDDPENSFGNPLRTVDLRMLGYRVLTPPSEVENCTFLFEWALKTWERHDILATEIFEIQIDVDTDDQVDYYVFNAGLGSRHSTFPGEILIGDAFGEVHCSGFHVEHSMFSSTTILRVCSESLGITEPGSMNMQARAVSVTAEGWSETTDVAPYASIVTYPTPELAAPSYDIAAGETLDTIVVNGSNGMANGEPPLGLMLVVDAYRRPDSTGAAVLGSETLVLMQDFATDMLALYEEKTLDIRQIPPARDLQGPNCSWTFQECVASKSGAIGISNAAMETNVDKRYEHNIHVEHGLFQTNEDSEAPPSCAPVVVPRASVPTRSPSAVPSSQPSNSFFQTQSLNGGETAPPFQAQSNRNSTDATSHSSLSDVLLLNENVTTTPVNDNTTETVYLIEENLPGNATQLPEMTSYLEANTESSSPTVWDTAELPWNNETTGTESPTFVSWNNIPPTISPVSVSVDNYFTGQPTSIVHEDNTESIDYNEKQFLSRALAITWCSVSYLLPLLTVIAVWLQD